MYTRCCAEGLNLDGIVRAIYPPSQYIVQENHHEFWV
jgi:hypothetical protein